MKQCNEFSKLQKKLEQIWLPFDLLQIKWHCTISTALFSYLRLIMAFRKTE